MAKHKTQAERGCPQPLNVAATPSALLRMDTVVALSGLSIPTIYRRAATDPTFPELIKLSARCTRIRAGDLMAWLDAQAGRQAPERVEVRAPEAKAAPLAKATGSAAARWSARKAEVAHDDL